MTKYLKVMFGSISGAKSSLNYEIGKVNIAKTWNKEAKDSKEMGGFNFSTEDKILRWLIRGDTLYDVEIPSDAEVVEVDSVSAPHGVFRTNKIIIKNPKIVTDEIAMELYKKSNLPEKSYYKSLAGCAIRGYKNTCLKIIEDKINKDNIDIVLEEINDFVTPYTSSGTSTNGVSVYEEVMDILNKIKENRL